MCKVFLVEEDNHVSEWLKSVLPDLDTGYKIVGNSRSLKEASSWFHYNEEPDLIVMEVNMSDGISFNVLKKHNIKSPIIYISESYYYSFAAFQNNGLAYLLKPLNREKLSLAFDKYKKFETHFNKEKNEIVNSTQVSTQKSRIVIKQGKDYSTLLLENVVFFYKENTLVYAYDTSNNRLLVHANYLSELEPTLDPAVFFRANRQFIININYLKGFKITEKSKLLVELITKTPEQIIISQQNSAVFKKWIDGL